MPALPILTEQVAQLPGQMRSFPMSKHTVSGPDNGLHLAKQRRASLPRATRGFPRDGSAGHDLSNGMLTNVGQLFNTESRDQ